METFSSSESRFRFWCVYTETFLCLYDDEGAIKMATSNSAATMDQTASGKERNAKAKEGTVSAKGKERTAKEKDGATKAKEQAFVWTDDEVELLLKVTHEYKVKKAGENVDWESVRSKYSDIWEQLKRQLPSDSEEARETGKDFPHKTEDITKQAVTTKLKAVRLKYRQAVDSGRKSGHGRVVLLYFEWCERIWGGSPATEQISSGVETVDLDESQAGEQETQSSSLDSSLTTTETEGVHTVDSTLLNQASGGEPSSQSRVQQRRAFLDDKLSNYKQEKLKRKLPVDSQLAKEEIEVKKRLLDQMDRMDTQYSENMSKLSANMDRLTNSIADGFALLRGLLLPQQPAYHSQQHPMYGPPPQPMYHPPQQPLHLPQQPMHPPQQPMHPPQQPMYSGQQHQVISGSATSEDTSEPASPQSPGDQYSF